MTTVADLLARIEEETPEGRRGRSHVKLRHELRVAGLPFRWYDGPKPADVEGYVYLEGIVGTEPYKARFDSIAGYVAAGGTKVQIRQTSTNRAALFMRAPGGEDITRRMRATLLGDTEAPFDLPLSTVDGLEERIGDYIADHGALWIGLEAFIFDTVDAEAGTVHVVERGAWGSMPRSHYVDAEQGWAPRAYDDPCTWPDRDIELWMTLEVAGRRHPAAIERMPGYIATPPTRTADGVVSVAGTPQISGMEKKIGGKPQARAGLSPWLCFLPGSTGRRQRVDQVYPPHAAWSVPLAVPALDDPPGYVCDVAAHVDVFDVAASGALRGDRIQTPRPQRLERNNPYLMADGERVGVRLAPSEEQGLEIGRIGNDTARLVRMFDLINAPGAVFSPEGAVRPTPGAVAVRWPQAFFRLVNQTARPGSSKADEATEGHEPAFIDMQLVGSDPAAEGAPAFRCRTTARLNERAPHIELQRRTREQTMYGVDVADPDDNEPDWVDLPGTPRVSPADRSVPILARRDDGGASTSVPLRRIAQGGWYQTGMTLINVTRSDIWPAPPFVAELKGKNGDADVTLEVRVSAAYPASDVFGPDVPGFLLEVDPADALVRSIADWTGEDSVQVRPIPSWRGVSVIDVLLQLLTSTDGRQVNGPHDVLIQGAGVPFSLIDVQSFRDFALPGGIGDRLDVLRLEGEKKIREVVGPLLRVIGAQITMRLDEVTGRRRIVLERAGVVFTPHAAATLRDGEWKLPNLPGDDREKRVVTGVTYLTNYVDDKPQIDITIVDKDRVGERGGREHLITEELRGIKLTGLSPASHDAALRASAQQLFARAGMPHVLVPGVIAASAACRLDAGSTVIVHSSTSHDVNGTLGINGLPGRIVEYAFDPDEGVCTLTIQVMRSPVKAIAPALEVVQLFGPRRLRVARNKHQKSRDRAGRAVRDMDHFRVGQAIQLVPRRRNAPRLVTRITTKNRDADWIEIAHDHNFDGYMGVVRLPKVQLSDPQDQLRYAAWGDPEGKVALQRTLAAVYG